MKARKMWVMGFIAAAAVVLWLSEWGASPVARIETIRTERMDVQLTVRMIGEVKASRLVPVVAQTPGDQGRILRIVDEGTLVDPGDLIMELDREMFESSKRDLMVDLEKKRLNALKISKESDWMISQAEAEKSTAEFELEVAKLQLKRVEYGDIPGEKQRLEEKQGKLQQELEQGRAYLKALEAYRSEGSIDAAQVEEAKGLILGKEAELKQASQQLANQVEFVFPAQLEAARAALLRAEVRVSQTAQSLLIRQEKDVFEGQQADLEIRGLEDKVAKVDETIANCRVKAETRGIISHVVDFRSGERRKPKPGDFVFQNRAVMYISVLDRLLVEGRAAESDLQKVEVDSPATVFLTSIPGTPLKARVASIGASVDEGSVIQGRVFPVSMVLEELLPEQSARIRPGMTGEVVAKGALLTRALTAPASAVGLNENGYAIWLRGVSGTELRNVKLGPSEGGRVVILEGLSDEDLILENWLDGGS